LSPVPSADSRRPAIPRDLARVGRLGAAGYARYRWMRLRNRIFRLVNLVGPARHRCPCCGWRGARFLDFVRETRVTPGIVCPRCRSQPRHRALSAFLVDHLATLPVDAAVLHFAPERALVRVFAQSPRLRYVGVDRDRRARDLRADVTALPFRAETFNLVLSCHLLEHVRDDTAALAEMARVTIPGGSVLIMAPTVRDCETRPTIAFAEPDWQGHWRNYGCDLLDRLEAMKLRARLVWLARVLPPGQQAELAVHPEPLFIGEKPARPS